MRIAWQFIDDSTGTPETYRFDVNPKEDSGSFGVNKNIIYSNSAGDGGNTLIREGVENPQRVSYRGTLLSQAQYEALEYWANKEHPIKLVDDLGRESRIMLESIEFERVRSQNHPWKHNYTIEGYVL